MADLQEIVKTHPKSYPSYFHTYPRNGKTTVEAASGKKARKMGRPFSQQPDHQPFWALNDNKNF